MPLNIGNKPKNPNDPNAGKQDNEIKYLHATVTVGNNLVKITPIPDEKKKEQAFSEFKVNKTDLPDAPTLVA